MPHLVLVENGRSASSRSVKQLTSLLRAGWEVTVVAGPDAERDPALEGMAVVSLPLGGVHPGVERRKAELQAAQEELAALQVQVQDAASNVRTLPVAERDVARDRLVEARAAVGAAAARVRALRAERTIELPLARPYPYGDPLRLRSFWAAAAAVIAALPCDVVQAADLDALPAAVWGVSAHGQARLVYDAHELFQDLDYLPGVYVPAWCAIAETFVPHADKVLTVSQQIADVLSEECGARAAAVVRNLPLRGSTATSTLRRDLGLPPRTPLAVHVGAVRVNREPLRAVDLLQGVGDLHVAFLGDASAEAQGEIEREAAAAGVADRLHFVPPVPMEQLVSYVRDADVGLSLYTGGRSRHLRSTLPNKLFDLLAAGVPVVASADTACGAYVAEEGVGRCFEPGDAQSLPRAVSAVLGSPDVRRRVAGGTADHVWEVEGEAYVRHIVSLMAPVEAAG